ncbi:hypothetical protein NA78x_006169 [Anatilimnocola sp. NA78]|uniref:hypothetical protein n=1 Tax=Anatilimnocola sp. NA78 TaxID=3415683 RepID=UPI003CE51C9D
MARPKKKQVMKNKRPLGDWRGDNLYDLVFCEAEETWRSEKESQQFAKQKGVKITRRAYILLEEYGESDYSSVEGDVLRAWTFDDTGLVEISLAEHALHRGEIAGRTFPFVMMMFHIHENRKHIVLGYCEANTSGSGCVYRVESSGEEVSLEHDESLGFWRS